MPTANRVRAAPSKAGHTRTDLGVRDGLRGSSVERVEVHNATNRGCTRNQAEGDALGAHPL
jgi:hypothetical protein